ncbi:MAG: hypothetical protein V4727_04910 [Verrucomicrobiota bacterium]
MEETRKPWWRYIYLLGFDAPLIAVLWLFIFAKTWRVNYLPWQAYVALGLMVWALRITAKLLRSAMLPNLKDPLQEIRTWLVRSAVSAGVLSIVLIVVVFPVSIYLRLLLLGLFVIGYFAIANFSPAPEGKISYAKHIIAGVAMAFGITTIAHVYLPSLTSDELFKSQELISFGLLCIIASTAVDHWVLAKNHEGSRYSDDWQIALPLTLLGAFALVFAVQAESQTTRPFFYCILTAAALLQVLNRTFYRFQISDIKILTSACFLVPGLIFQAYQMSL